MQVVLQTRTRRRNDHPLFPFNAHFPSSPKCCCIVHCTLHRFAPPLLTCPNGFLQSVCYLFILLQFSLSYFCSYVCNSASSVFIFVVNILTCRLCFACPFRWFSAHHAPAPVCCRNFYGKTCKRSNIKLLQAMWMHQQARQKIRAACNRLASVTDEQLSSCNKNSHVCWDFHSNGTVWRGCAQLWEENPYH